MGQVIEFQSITKRFRNTVILQDVSTSLDKGELAVLEGPNGSGKSTLLKLAATLIHPSSGSIKINDVDARQDPKHARSFISYLSPDERGFYWKLSGWDNLRFFSKLQGLAKPLFRKRVSELAEELNIHADLSRHFQEYSSGMRQKLSLIRSFMVERSLYLLDEPERNLDKASVETLNKWIKQALTKGCSVFLVTAFSTIDVKAKRYTISNGSLIRGQG